MQFQYVLEVMCDFFYVNRWNCFRKIVILLISFKLMEKYSPRFLLGLCGCGHHEAPQAGRWTDLELSSNGIRSSMNINTACQEPN
jgi:hypothetical protein